MTMKLPNKTHYHDQFTRIYNEVPDNDSFAFESSKRLSYYQRLYWEYEACKLMKGKTFYYTFTYNNNALPHYMGLPVFDYSHVRKLTNGRIQKELLRKYGLECHYAIFPENGEGGLTHNYKGKRGKGNNPHYHTVFFLFPRLKRDDKGSIVLPLQRDMSVFQPREITALKFRELVRSVWQYCTTLVHENGKWTHKDIYTDWKNARFGHCQEGSNLGEVKNDDPFGYIAKYCIKDKIELTKESIVEKRITETLTKAEITSDVFHEYYLYLIENMAERNMSYSWEEFAEDSCMSAYEKYSRNISYSEYVQTYCPEMFEGENSFYQRIYKFWKEIYLPETIKQQMAYFHNTYGQKVRMSKCLGLYGMTFIQNIEHEPYFYMRDSQKALLTKNKPTLYYYRKLYYDVVKCPITNNPLYVLNALGIRQHINTLPEKVYRYMSTIHKALLWFTDPSNHVEDYYKSYDKFSIDYVRTMVSVANYNYFDIAVYNLVYRYRMFVDLPSVQLSPCLAALEVERLDMNDVAHDYEIFLKSNFYTCDYHENSVHCYVREEGRQSFSSLPCFKSIIRLIPFFDIIMSTYNDMNSKLFKDRFNEKSELLKKHNANEYNIH